PVAPEAADVLTLELRDAGGTVFSASLDHPASDRFWRKRRGKVQFVSRASPLSSVTLRSTPSGAVQLDVRGRHATFTGLDDPQLPPRVRIGAECFGADLGGRCTLDAKRLRCH